VRLAGAAGVMKIRLPSIEGETATIAYRELVPDREGLTLRNGSAVLKRSGGRWILVGDRREP